MKTFIKNLPAQIASTFTVMLICFTTINFVRGIENIPLIRLIELFGLAVIGGILMEFSFGQCVFQKISDFTRICIFIIPFCIVTFLFAVLCQWITKLHVFETYIKFIGIFLVCGIFSFLVCEIEHRIRGKKYTQKLKEYQTKEETENE